MTTSPTASDPPKPFQLIKFSKSGSHILLGWRVREGDQVNMGTVLFEYQPASKNKISKFTSSSVGLLHRILVWEGESLTTSSILCEIEKNCDHPEVVCGMCTHCGENLQNDVTNSASGQAASVPIVLGIPQILVSKKQAEDLAKEDKHRLLRQKKLALIVDLDQTLVHTSTDINIRAGLPDVYGFRLKNYPHCYHARLRPHVHEFLDKISSLYELYIFTMGTHCYAHTLSKILDPQRKLFSQRIISRDECFDSRSKLPTIRSVFPCGDEMVAIIDDREDMWARCPNLVHVKPYIFFGSTGDIHAPERMCQPQMEQVPPPPSHFPTIVTPPPPLPSQPQQSQTTTDTKTDGEPPTESDSGEVHTDNLTFNTDSVASQASEHPEEQEPPPVPNQPAREPEPDPVDPPVVSKEETGRSDEQLMAPISSSSESSDSSDVTNSPSDSSSSRPPEAGKSETEIKPDTNVPQAVPVPPQDPVEPAVPTPPPQEPVTPSEEEPVPGINDPDKFLLYLIDTLTTIHSIFYEKYKQTQSTHGTEPSKEQQLMTPDLKEIIPRLRHSVLKGACLLFTGVIPTNRNPQEDPIWNTARAFGAVIHNRIYKPHESSSSAGATTHVVTTKPGTNKYREAIRVPGIRIVTPDWLWACAESWKWMDEKEFPIRARRPSRDKPGQQQHKKPHLSTDGVEQDESAPPVDTAEYNENVPTSHQHMDTVESSVPPLDLDLSGLPDESERVFSPDRISFSLEDINAMNDEVNSAIYDGSSSSSSNELQDYPEGVGSRKRKRPVNSEPNSDNTTDTGSSTEQEAAEGKFDDIAALLEREFEADPV